jgi:hypothetical protein
MNIDMLVGCMAAVNKAFQENYMKEGNLGLSQIQHALEQMQAALALEAKGLTTKLEEPINTVVRSARGGEIEVNRRVDVMAEGIVNDLRTRINVEVKTGDINNAMAKVNHLTQDAAIAINNAKDKSIDQFFNVWKLSGTQFFEGGAIRTEAGQAIKDGLQGVLKNLKAEKFTEKEIQAAIGSFHFVDEMGNAIRAEVNRKGEIILAPAMDIIFSPDGKLAQVAKDKAGHSPNFGPAMEMLFGPTGKLAMAVVEGTTTTNLGPAVQGLEKKVEQGVTQALDEAGTAASRHSISALGKHIGEGASALGTALTALPMLTDSVKGLGEAWDKPLNSTADYMALFSAAGNTIMQGVQTFEAFANITKIASAAQAVFNAVMAMNPIVLIILAVIALIAAIVLLIVYWDEVKLAVLKAANFISIELQKVGHFFVGVGKLVGQVWDWIVAQTANLGISIVNFFIKIGTDIQNFFIHMVNKVLEMYNKIADSVIGDVLGLEKANLIPEVDVATRLIPPKEVPKIDVDAAFKPAGEIKGGLEEAITEQQATIDRKKAEEAAKQGTPAPGGLPALAGPAIPTEAAPGGPTRPELPGVSAAAAGSAGPVDQSVKIEGGITVNIDADRLAATPEQLVALLSSDEVMRQIAEGLNRLTSQQNFRLGTRSSAANA